MHVGLGSPINLTCVVAYSPEPPDYLHWYHKEKVRTRRKRVNEYWRRMEWDGIG